MSSSTYYRAVPRKLSFPLLPFYRFVGSALPLRSFYSSALFAPSTFPLHLPFRSFRPYRFIARPRSWTLGIRQAQAQTWRTFVLMSFLCIYIYIYIYIYMYVYLYMCVCVCVCVCVCHGSSESFTSSTFLDIFPVSRVIKDKNYKI